MRTSDGVEGGIRTPDQRLRRPPLCPAELPRQKLGPRVRFELTTCDLGGHRSIRLSYPGISIEPPRRASSRVAAALKKAARFKRRMVMLTAGFEPALVLIRNQVPCPLGEASVI